MSDASVEGPSGSGDGHDALGKLKRVGIAVALVAGCALLAVLFSFAARGFVGAIVVATGGGTEGAFVLGEEECARLRLCVWHGQFQSSEDSGSPVPATLTGGFDGTPGQEVVAFDPGFGQAVYRANSPVALIEFAIQVVILGVALVLAAINTFRHIKNPRWFG